MAVAFRMFQAVMGENEKDGLEFEYGNDDLGNEGEDDWREECLDDDECGVDPYDYDTLEEYEEAKEYEEISGWYELDTEEK